MYIVADGMQCLNRGLLAIRSLCKLETQSSNDAKSLVVRGSELS